MLFKRKMPKFFSARLIGLYLVIIVILALGILSMIIYGFIKNIPAKTCVNENVTFFDFLG